jgi:hypothetical protein
LTAWGQKVDAHAELPNPVCLLENLDLDALLVQAERRAEAAYAATDHERLHRPLLRSVAGFRMLGRRRCPRKAGWS